MIDAAIVGLGKWGQTLVDSVQGKSDKIRIAMGVTRTPAKAADYAKAKGFPLHDDYAAALADPKIKAVLLATPHTQHAEQVIAAAKAGKHVFVEKPFTMTKSSAEAAVAACKKAGVVMALGHNRRFLPATRELKRMVQAGELGTILHLEGNFSGPGGLSYRPGTWRAAPEESPAGGMAGSGIHMVDAMINICGAIRDVYALSQHRVLDNGLDDTTAMLFHFRQGMTGYLGTLAATARIWRLQIFGSKGWAEMRNHETLVTANLEGKTAERSWPKTDIERAELEAFADAVAGGPAYPLPVEDAIHGVAVYEALIASAKQGKTVKIS